jgi:outer membrane protein W
MTIAIAVAVLTAIPAAAGELSIIGSGHWLEKSGEDESENVFAGRAVDFDFGSGSGVGVGLLYEFSSRWGVEVKASFARMDVTARSVLPDAVFLLDLGGVNAVPVTAVLQWRPLEREWNPYIGAGGAQLFLSDLSAAPGSSIDFKATTGLVLNGGLDVGLSERWLINVDLKYIPFETASEARSGLGPAERVRFEPLLASAGMRYRF